MVADMVANLDVHMVADMAPDKKELADMELDKVADMEVDKVADKEADMVDDNKKIDINMEIQFGERVGHGSWLIGPKLF